MTKPAGGGFLFNVFNIGFTVVMFALPTVLLAYWYMYIRDPGGQQNQQTVVVQQRTEKTPAATQGPATTPKSAGAGKKSSGIFSENPAGLNSIATPNVPQERKTQPVKKREAPVRSEYEMRTWSDPSGKFSIEARFYSATTDKVKLLKKDDQKLDVEIAKLSEDDKEYLRGLFKAKGFKTRF